MQEHFRRAIVLAPRTLRTVRRMRCARDSAWTEDRELAVWQCEKASIDLRTVEILAIENSGINTHGHQYNQHG